MTWFDRRGVRAAARPAKRTSPGGRAETCTNRYKSVNDQTVSTADLGWPIDVLRWDRFWINKRTSGGSRVRLARPRHPHAQCCGARAASRALRKCAFIYPPRSALNGATLATLNAGGKGGWGPTGGRGCAFIYPKPVPPQNVNGSTQGHGGNASTL